MIHHYSPERHLVWKGIQVISCVLCGRDISKNADFWAKNLQVNLFGLLREFSAKHLSQLPHSARSTPCDSFREAFLEGKGKDSGNLQPASCCKKSSISLSDVLSLDKCVEFLDGVEIFSKL